MSDKNPSIPSVYKKEELDLMIEMVDAGVWSNKNLVTSLHIDESTVIQWKKRPEVQEAHRKAILKWMKKRKDAEIALREMGLDTPQEAPKTLVQINYQPIFGGKSADALPTNHSDTQDIRPEEEN
jgi:hypothetical protein